MQGKIEVSTEFLVNILIEKLKKVNKNVSKVDEKLYENEQLYNEWELLREATLILDDLISGLE